MKPIFDYMNYREYLDDMYKEKKEMGAFYSFRIFSQKAGFKSPNFLKLVIKGERNLSKESVFKFVKALKLNRNEADYFENLVFFNQSKTLEEKNSYLKKMMKYRKKSDPHKIEESEYKYYSAWYHPVVRELAAAADFKDDYKKLGKMVIPPITPLEAEKSVKLLLNLDFIRKVENDGYRLTEKSLTTGPTVRSIAVANYHKEMMKLASESIERFSSQEREVTSLTLTVSEDTVDTIKQRLKQFREDLLELTDGEKNPQQVVQLNLQLFPLSEKF